MDRSGLYGQLALNKQLLGIAEARFAALTDGLDHPRIETARDKLSAAAAAITAAAGGISMWTRTWVGTVALGVGAWATAAVAGQLIGLSAGWTITVTVAVVVALGWPVSTLNNVLADRVNRRRTAPPAPYIEIVGADGRDPAAEIVAILGALRDGLAIVMKRWTAAHRFGYLARSAAGFDWLRQQDPHLLGVSVADRYVCQAIHSIEIWVRHSELDR